MFKKSKNVDKRCTFSLLASCYDHLYVMNDKRKTTIVWFSFFIIHFATAACDTVQLDMIQPTISHSNECDTATLYHILL